MILLIQIHAWDKKDGAQDKTNSVKQVGPTMDAEEQTNQQPFAGEVPDMTKGKYSTGDQNRTYTDTATEQTDDVVESSNIQKQNRATTAYRDSCSLGLHGTASCGKSVVRFEKMEDCNLSCGRPFRNFRFWI